MAESTLYSRLSNTASSWVISTRPKVPGTNEPDYGLIRSWLSADATIHWGHGHFVSTSPPLQGHKTPQGFVDHLSFMSPKLETWTIEIADVNVDVERKSAVVRADFNMQAKGDAQTIRNEILFWCVMDDTGGKVVKSTEFVDPAATGALMEKMKPAAGRH